MRKEDSHKGDYGKLMIIAGSPGMAGAAVLCARGAYRSGAGLVKVSLPEALFPVLQISVPEAICLKREEKPEDLQSYDGIIIGPGIGQDSLELKLLEWILKEYDKKILLDADGLNLIASGDRIRWLHQTRARLILTPHPGKQKSC
jgi:Predicted sugar kinase